MAVLSALPRFFLAANTNEGYISRFETAYSAESGWRAFLLKGGITGAKSLLLKRLASALCERGEAVELIADVNDPKLACGVIDAAHSVAFFDADAPGYLTEKYPTVCERVVDFAALTDTQMLDRFAQRIKSGLQAANAAQTRAYSYIAAGANLLTDARRLAAECVDFQKAEKFALALAQRLIPQGSGGGERIRYISGLTAYGWVYSRSTVTSLCEQVYTLCDEWGAVSPAVLQILRRVALERGQRVICCLSPLYAEQRPEHILLPDAKLAFVTANRYLEQLPCVRRYHARRFTDAAALRGHAQRMKFCKRAAEELLQSGTQLLSSAAAEREQVRGCYDAAVQFDALTLLCDTLLKQM